jgi:hypothetical protein
MGQQRTDFLPDRQVQQSGPHLGVLTEPLAAKAVGVRAQAAGIGVRARLACARTRTQALPLQGRATVLTWQQALPQIQGTPTRLPGMALVFPPLLLDRCEHRGLHERWDRDRDPLLRWDITGGHGTTRLHGTSALGPQPGPPRLLARLANLFKARHGFLYIYAE